MSITKLVNGINATWYNGPVLLPFYDGSDGLRAGQIAYDQIGVVVPGVPGMVYWNGSNWVQFLGTSTIPTLQQVTDMGATTTHSITIEDTADDIARELVVSVNGGIAEASISAEHNGVQNIATLSLIGNVPQIIVSTNFDLRILNADGQALLTVFANGSGVMDQNNVARISGTGDPNGSEAAVVGSTYSRIDGAPGETFYIKQTGTGNTGWVPLA